MWSGLWPKKRLRQEGLLQNRPSPFTNLSVTKGRGSLPKSKSHPAAIKSSGCTTEESAERRSRPKHSIRCVFSVLISNWKSIESCITPLGEGGNNQPGSSVSALGERERYNAIAPFEHRSSSILKHFPNVQFAQQQIILKVLFSTLRT